MTNDTTVDPRLYELLRAMAHGQADRAIEIADELDQAGWPGGELVLGVAFAHAVDREFGPAPDDYDIDRLAAHAVAGQDDGPSHADVTRLIRAALDQPHLVGHTDPATRTAAQLLVLCTLLPSLVRGEAVEQFVGEVMLSVVWFLAPPVGVGASAWRKA
jgi:hypothetical protein